jgi:hypothetical protein
LPKQTLISISRVLVIGRRFGRPWDYGTRVSKDLILKTGQNLQVFHPAKAPLRDRPSRTGINPILAAVVTLKRPGGSSTSIT